MKLTLQIALLFAFAFNVADAETLDPRIEAVKAYILKGHDYPELFNGKEYRMKIQDVVIGDLDIDGVDEVVLQVKPHYLQSPTIIIYHVDKDMQVSRVIEGLAPGLLQKRGDYYLDSHTLKSAVDFEIKAAKGKKPLTQSAQKAAVESVLEKGGSVVQYKDWLHADYRSGKGTYIDMRHVKVPNKEHNCEHF